MLYGREPITSNELKFVDFVEPASYEVAVQSHIKDMIAIHNKALEANRGYQLKYKKQWDLRRVHHKNVLVYQLDQRVWYDVHRSLRTKEKGISKWLGPCTVSHIYPGNLYDLEYLVDSLAFKFRQVHPQFLKPFRGEQG